MNSKQRILTVVVTAFMAKGTATWAQKATAASGEPMQMQNKPGMQSNDGQMQSGKKMPMMEGCQKHMHAMMASNAQTTKNIEAAKQSNGPAKMRAPLGEAEKALSPMNKSAMGCMNSMKNMHGSSGMMGSGSMDNGQAKKP